MTVLHALKRIRQTLARGWTQQAMARNGFDIPVHAHSHEACKWCIYGAMDKIPMPAGIEGTIHSLLIDKINGERISTWNDAPGRTQEQVLDIFDKLIFETERRC